MTPIQMRVFFSQREREKESVCCMLHVFVCMYACVVCLCVRTHAFMSVFVWVQLCVSKHLIVVQIMLL